MKNVLVISSSIHGDSATSHALSHHFLANLGSESCHVVHRDFAKNPLPHLSEAEFSSWSIPNEDKNDEERRLSELSDTIVEEVMKAELIVVSAPMYNFGIPSSLKAWIDRLARAGKTFNYTENGPKGLLGGRKLVILATRGGSYKGTPMDSQTDYLKTLFNFLGITDIEFVYAEGLAQSGQREKSISEAKSQLDALVQ